jgi:hypothetical protein
MFPEGARPIPPIIDAPMSVNTSPNMFDATTTSNSSGLSTMSLQAASNMSDATVTSGYSSLTSSTISSQNAIVCC